MVARLVTAWGAPERAPAAAAPDTASALRPYSRSVKSRTHHRVDERSYIDRRVEAVDAAQLEGPVRSVLRDPATHVTGWRHQRIAYDFLNPSSGGIYRFAGTPEAPGHLVTWALVLKVTRAAETLEHDTPVAQDLAQSTSEAVLWDRELLAYESGFIAGLRGDLVAAACHGGVRNDDDTCWLWLEDLGAGEQPEWSLDHGRSSATRSGRSTVPTSLPRSCPTTAGWDDAGCARG